MRFRTAGIVIFAVVAACVDPQAATQACPPRFVAQVQDVPGVAMDLPPEPRSWDTSGTALEEAIAQQARPPTPRAPSTRDGERRCRPARSSRGSISWPRTVSRSSTTGGSSAPPTFACRPARPPRSATTTSWITSSRGSGEPLQTGDAMALRVMTIGIALLSVGACELVDPQDPPG